MNSTLIMPNIKPITFSSFIFKCEQKILKYVALAGFNARRTLKRQFNYSVVFQIDDIQLDTYNITQKKS